MLQEVQIREHQYLSKDWFTSGCTNWYPQELSTILYMHENMLLLDFGGFFEEECYYLSE